MRGSAVWVDVLPSLAEFGSRMTGEATAAARKAGTAAGRQFSTAMAAGSAGGAGASSMVKDLEAASVRVKKIIEAERLNIFKARTAEKAATELAAAAEAKLAEVREVSGAASSQALRAEAALTTARGKQQLAGVKTLAVEDQLRAAYGQQKKVAMDLVDAQLLGSRKTVTFQQGLTGLAAAGEPVATGIGRAGKAVGGFAASVTSTVVPLAQMAAGFAAILGVGKIITLGNQYTKTMNEFQAVTSLTDDAMVEVRATARALGSDLSLPATSGADAAAVMVELAKGGLSAADAMDAAKGTITLAAAAQVDGARAAEIQANAINQFGLAASDASMVADVLANTANAAAGGVDDIATSMKYVGPVARAMGISIGDTAAAVGILANNGLKGDTAGTALRGMLASLASPSAEGAAALKELNIQAFDSQGNFVGMTSVIDQLSRAQKNMTQEQFANAAANAFGREPLAAVTALASSGATAYTEMASAVTKQGGAATVAASQMKGLGGVVDKVQSQLEDIALGIYDTVAPSLVAAGTVIAEGLDGAGDKVNNFLQIAGGLGKLVIGGDYTGVLNGLGLTEDSIPVDVILTARDKVIGGFQSIVTFVQQSLIPSFGNIAVAVGPLVAILLGVLVVAFQSIGAILRDYVGPALVAVTGFLRDNPGVVIAFAVALGVLTAAFYAQKAVLAVQGAGGLLKYIKGIKLVRVATGLWAAGQWALNLALNANPIGLIIVAIAALVAGVIWAYNNVGWFRDAVDAAFAGIMVAIGWLGDAAVWLWENAIKPTWDAIATGATWLWQTILKPAFDGIGAVFQFVGGLVMTYIGFWVSVFTAVGTAAAWLWTNALKPAFDGIWAVISWVSVAIFAVFDLLVHILIYVVGAAFTWLWENVISPVFNWIADLVSWWWTTTVNNFTMVVNFVRDVLGAIFTWLWNTIISPVFTWISDKINVAVLGWQIIFGVVKDYISTTLAPIFTWLWTNIIKPAFDGISSTIKWVWDNAIKPVFDALKGFVQDTLPKAFETGRDAIGKAWEGLKELAKAPIKFVVDTVINDGLIGNFNKLADFFGSKKIPEISLPKGFAGGGVIPGYQSQKRDDVMMPMRRGEGVLVPEVVKALGPGFVHRLNAAGNTGGATAVRQLALPDGLAEGGIVGGVIDWIGDAAGAASSFISDPLGSMKKVIDPILEMVPGAEGIASLAKGAGSKLVTAAVDAIKKLGPGPATATGANGQLPAGMLSKVANFVGGPGVGPMGGYLRTDAARALTLAEGAKGGALPLTEGYRDLASQQMRFSAYRSGMGNLAAVPGTSNHGFGLAGDFATGAQAWLAKNGPAYGWYPTGLGFSQREPWHFDYKGKGGNGSTGMFEGGLIEPTLYDGGGMLNQGVSIIANNTKKPEFALPEGKLIDIVRAASEGERGGDHYEPHFHNEGREFTERDYMNAQQKMETLAGRR